MRVQALEGILSRHRLQSQQASEDTAVDWLLSRCEALRYKLRCVPSCAQNMSMSSKCGSPCTWGEARLSLPDCLCPAVAVRLSLPG
jgi:precorrin-3B methylase